MRIENSQNNSHKNRNKKLIENTKRIEKMQTPEAQIFLLIFCLIPLTKSSRVVLNLVEFAILPYYLNHPDNCRE